MFECILKNTTQTCWCSDPSIKFPKELLSTIPDNMKGKACICKRCVLNFKDELNSSIPMNTLRF
ncbi:cysteine-rich CWC family protein [Vibrio hannami]|uniref:cysteine-rich CWC family protein n=1 Tax=Vibrio hannami TaxID=2717094 RepID=UPI003BB123AC